MAGRITQLETQVKEVEGKLQVAENNAKANDTTSQRITRSKSAPIPSELTNQINDLSEKSTMLQDRLQEVEDIVE
jgi:hypothetical protein